MSTSLEQVISCTGCGQALTSGGKVCPQCGKDLTEVQKEPVNAARKPAKANQIPCPFCGEMITKRRRKCPACNSALPWATKKSPRATSAEIAAAEGPKKDLAERGAPTASSEILPVIESSSIAEPEPSEPINSFQPACTSDPTTPVASVDSSSANIEPRAPEETKPEAASIVEQPPVPEPVAEAAPQPSVPETPPGPSLAEAVLAESAAVELLLKEEKLMGEPVRVCSDAGIILDDSISAGFMTTKEPPTLESAVVETPEMIASTPSPPQDARICALAEVQNRFGFPARDAIVKWNPQDTRAWVRDYLGTAHQVVQESAPPVRPLDAPHETAPVPVPDASKPAKVIRKRRLKLKVVGLKSEHPSL